MKLRQCTCIAGTSLIAMAASVAALGATAQEKAEAQIGPSWNYRPLKDSR